MPLTRDDLKELPRLLQDDLELKLEIAEQILDDTVVSRLMERNERLRETFRRAVMTEALLQLPEQFKKFSEETTTRFERVEKRIERVEHEVVGIKNEVAGIKKELTEVKQGVSELQNWQRGEVGRRTGEDYERKIVKRAARILGLGEGGSPETSERVNRQVVEWLHQAGVLEGDYPEEDDPLEADLIWWKGNRVVLAEISIKVDRDDVVRAKRRAEVLRQAGLEVLPVVIGNEWAHPETEAFATQEGVGWRIGNKVSESIVRFRRDG
jgi:hypothetical protein